MTDAQRVEGKNYSPTMETILKKMAGQRGRRGPLFAVDEMRVVMARLRAVEAERDEALIENDAARKSIGEAWDTAVANGQKIRALEADVQRLTAERDAARLRGDMLLIENDTVKGERHALQERERALVEALAELLNYADEPPCESSLTGTCDKGYHNSHGLAIVRARAALTPPPPRP